MPLRDHFRSPVNDKHSWEELHGGWPAMIVQQLFHILPAGYVAGPCVRLGRMFDFDAMLSESHVPTVIETTGEGDGSTIDLPALPHTLTLETELGDQDEYEVRVYDTQYGRHLIAAIELVSPSNKNSRANRAAFVAKVAALLQKDVCVSIVDPVTIRRSNLYAELLDLIDGSDPQLGREPDHLYAVTMRTRKRRKLGSLLDVWYHPMTVGEPLPTIPIWLSPDLQVLLPLEPGYEETCWVLHIK